MAWTFKFKKKADKEFSKLPIPIQKRISRFLADRRDRHPSEYSVQMTGASNFSRIRIGDYRLIIYINEEIELVTILKAAHRKDIYRP